MNRFDENKACVKCGNSSASIEFVPRRTLNDLRGSPVDEHIKRKCNRCGYAWQESPLDESKHELGNLLCPKLK